MLFIILGIITVVGVASYFIFKSKDKSSIAPVSSIANDVWQITDIHDGQQVVVTADRNHGGCIYSLKLGDTEFIDYSDKGRELQTAWTMNGHGEQDNPTEAGASADTVGSSTSVLAARTDGNILRTYVQLAYWFPFNGLTLSPHKLGKTVSFLDGYTNVLHHQITATIVGDQQFINMEGLTSYSPQTFNRFFKDGVEISAPQQMYYNLSTPTIIANSDLSKAICLYGPTGLYHYGGASVVWPKLDCSSYQTTDVKAGDYS